MTARAAAGGMLRLYLMETTFPVDLRSDFPSGNADADALAGYFLLGACIIYARNGAKVILPLRYTTKINDALRKRYFLDS
jgi:fluoride ion exporter CrcB/FEX